jgi:hypothetical protein
MRKHTNRTVYALVPGRSPLEIATYNAAKLTPEEWNEQIVPVQVAIDGLCRGEWSNDNWQAVFDVLNRIESMLKLAKRPDHGFLDGCKAIFVTALDRRESTGATAFKAQEMATVKDIGQVYGDLLKEITHKQFQMACAHTNANVARIIKCRKGVKKVSGCLIEVANG